MDPHCTGNSGVGTALFKYFPVLPCAGNRFVGREDDGDMRGNAEEMSQRAYEKVKVVPMR